MASIGISMIDKQFRGAKEKFLSHVLLLIQSAWPSYPILNSRRKKSCLIFESQVDRSQSQGTQHFRSTRDSKWLQFSILTPVPRMYAKSHLSQGSSAQAVLVSSNWPCFIRYDWPHSSLICRIFIL